MPFIKYNNLLPTITYLVLVFFFTTGCRKSDNTNRIRPVSDHTEIENRDEINPIVLADIVYDIKKNGVKLNYPALTRMTAGYTIPNSDTLFNIVIDNSFTKNDTLFYDILDIKFRNLRTNEITIPIEYDPNTVTYRTGNQFRSKLWYVPSVETSQYLEYSYLTFEEPNTSRKKFQLTLTTNGEYNHFSGTIEFVVK